MSLKTDELLILLAGIFIIIVIRAGLQLVTTFISVTVSCFQCL